MTTEGIKRKYKCLTLARQWCDLNCFEWPDDIDGKPKGYDEMTQ